MLESTGIDYVTRVTKIEDMDNSIIVAVNEL